MKCTNCGAPVNENAIVCTQCGSMKEKRSVIHNNKSITSLKLGAGKSDKHLDDSKDKKLKKLLIIVIVLIVLSGSFLAYLLISKNSSKDNKDDTVEKDKDNKDDKKETETDNKESEDKKEDNNSTPKGYKRIGSKGYGYINIPEKWTGSEDENKGAAYFDPEDEDVNNIIILVMKKTENTKTIEEMYDEFYKEAEQKEENEVEKKEIKVLDYKVYQLSEKIEDQIFYTWIFEGTNNEIHTIFLSYAIEIGDLSQIIYSYKDDK